MKNWIQKALLLLLVLLLSIPGAFAEEVVQPTGSGPEDGVYRIQSVSSGNYVNTFDLAYTASGFAYTAKNTSETGTHIRIERQTDGSYLLYPQSDGGEYAFYAQQNGGGSRIAKSKEVTNASHFRILAVEGSYVITTADGNFAWDVSGGDLLYRKPLVTLAGYSGKEVQRWSFTAIPVSSLEVKTVAERVNVNTVSAVYAVVTPTYMQEYVTWSVDDENVLLLDSDGSFCALSAGTATVTATVGDLSSSIEVDVVEDAAPTWYSQNLSADGGWHGDELSSVYFYAGRTRRFIIDRHNKNLDWMDSGCFLTSIAMVLKNLGARYTDGFDFRFNADGNVEADPYTVALANSGNRGLTTSSGTLYGNPILVSLSNITSRFTLFGKKLQSMQTPGVTKAGLKKMLDSHPEGVIVQMVNSANGTHYIVVTECINPDAKRASDYLFRIYDSAAMVRDQGYDVPFEESISFLTMRYRYGSMVSMTVFDMIPEE